MPYQLRISLDRTPVWRRVVVPESLTLASLHLVIQQAMGMPKSRGAEAAAYLAKFVEDMKAGSVVADALKRHGIQGASVVPAA